MLSSRRGWIRNLESQVDTKKDDPDLKGSEYVGELVISAEVIYHITPAGRVRELGATEEILLAEEGV